MKEMADGDTSVVEIETAGTNDKKRKISVLSSVSEIELDTSSNSPQAAQKKKTKKKKSKGGKTPVVSESETEYKPQPSKMAEELPPGIHRQLSDINQKLSNVITKGDGTLREMIRDIFQELKEEFLKSLSHRMDILEGKLFEKEKENDSLKKQISDLKTDIDNRKAEIEMQKSENSKLKREIDKSVITANEKFNDLEQYGRKSNLKIDGLPEAEGYETAEMTTGVFIDKMNALIPSLDLRREDVNIAHRLGIKKSRKTKGGETIIPRRAIVRLNSRIKRDHILKSRKLFKGTDIYVNEDLTQLNQLVLACVRRKMSDEVKKSWSRNGRIFYENKTGDMIEVKFPEFQDWIDLPWPGKSP